MRQPPGSRAGRRTSPSSSSRPRTWTAPPEAAAAVTDELAPRALLGCVADGVLAQGSELEEGPAAAVWASSLPAATVGSFHVAALETEDGLAVAGFPGVDDPALVALLVDPFSFPIGAFLQG